MRTWLIIIATALFLHASLASGITAQAGGKKAAPGPSERAYERANEKASFKRDEPPSQKSKKNKAGQSGKKEKVGRQRAEAEDDMANQKGNKPDKEPDQPKGKNNP